ncbi:MAG: iron chelate uptake ABC transporter family permease subunit [Clostridiales bacterium]|jgi:iron complex transport system permease protein|nr:iron chelate uptake ABC transporter family permease subunit [Clostridiales bacterium]
MNAVENTVVNTAVNTVDAIKSVYKKSRARANTAIGALAVISLILAVLSIMLGKTIYPLDQILRAIGGEEIKGVTFAVMTLRLPRMLTGLLAGAALGVAGASFQSMLRNSLASPDVIGVSSGSTAAAVFCLLALRWSGPAVSFTAIIVGLIVAALIFLLSGGGSFGGGKLILIGVGMGAKLNAFISFLLLKASEYDVPAAMRWMSGSLNGSKMSNVLPLAIAVAILCPASALLAGRLKILELGDEAAIALGVEAKLTRLILTLSAVGLVAFATSTTGPIAFVSFLSGPIAARLTGGGRAGTLPASLTGIVLVLGSDLIGQFAFDTRFPVGVITGILGAPYLIYLLIRSNQKGGSL